MEIAVITMESKSALRLKGRFDFNDHRTFKATYLPLLAPDTPKTLEVDLAGVEYIDSSALGMLLLLREQAINAGHEVLLAHPNATVRQILDIANFGKLFTVL